LARGATHALVEEREGRLEVTPHSLDEGDTFIARLDRVVSMDGLDPGRLGEALRAALEAAP
jgi:hypothetical protein